MKIHNATHLDIINEGFLLTILGDNDFYVVLKKNVFTLHMTFIVPCHGRAQARLIA